MAESELGLGESYQDGWWDANQLDEFIAEVQALDLRSLVRPRPGLALHIAKAHAMNRQTVRQARRNAGAHYNIGNDLYERMLDKRMIYSCGYWRRAHDLDQAQEDKLDLICRKLSLEPGMKLLDIGCGWGGFARFAASEHGVTVTGVTPAREQARVARDVCAGLPVEIQECDYRDVQGRFDRIVSIGMMEHVGPRNLKTFFERCNDLLSGDGVMLHHTIGVAGVEEPHRPVVRQVHLPRRGGFRRWARSHRPASGTGSSRTCRTLARTTTARSWRGTAT